MTARRASSGFTMIELMLAMAIFAFLTTIMWGSFAQTASSKKTIESEQERAHTVRVALMRMARELEMAYLSDNENTAIANRRTFFSASARADVDEVMFSSFAHQRLRAGAAEDDSSLISYYGAPDPDDRRVINLMRRETRRLQAEDPSTLPGEGYILCPDVTRVKFAFYDHRKKEWETEWSTLQASGTQYLPAHVRNSLTVQDARGKQVRYSIDARIQITENVSYRPAAVN
jgi:general secretion pathway protein J